VELSLEVEVLDNGGMTSLGSSRYKGATTDTAVCSAVSATGVIIQQCSTGQSFG